MLIGIVGKPNVGKSTFFSAATMATAEIANYPFTTIKPNKGMGYVRSKCPHLDFNVKCNPRNSACENGVRLVPIELLDVAGLVPVAPLNDPAMTQLDRLLSGLWDEDVVDGGTPTHDAYVYALSALRVSVPEGAAHMLLITDGRPTFALGCVGTGRSEDAVDEQPIVRAIAEARENGTRTFVIGSPGSEGTGEDGVDARPWLSRAASAGGTAREGCDHEGPVYCHFDMVDEPDFAAGLSTALGQITGTIMPCEYVVPDPPSGKTLAPTEVHVIWTLEDGSQHELLRDDQDECGEGWRYTGDGTRIALCPASCQRIRSASRDQLELFFGCNQIVVR